MSLIRILQTSKVTLTHAFTVDETLTDAAGAVTVTVKRLDGTDAGSGTATHTTLGTYTYALTPSAQLDTWTVDWSGSIAGAAVVARDVVEIVGGFLFGLDEGRAAHKSLASTTTYPTTLLAAKRIQVEDECARICGRSFVPRFGRLSVDGSGCSDLLLPDVDLRTIRAVSIQTQPGGAFVALTVDQLAVIVAKPSGLVYRGPGGIWPYGRRNIVIEYEYGQDFPPEDVRQAAIMRLRSAVTQTSAGVPDRALSFTVADGGVYRLSSPGPRATGIPEVDAAYSGHALDSLGFA